MHIEIDKLAEVLAGKLILPPHNKTISHQLIQAVSTDSRKACLQGIFFALRGENFDGHAYVKSACEQGCVAVVVEHVVDKLPKTACQIVVEDTKLALGKLAKWWREQLDLKMIAITGSSGKTTLKEMTASILARTTQRLGLPQDSVLYTQGNFNNDIGVPLTLLRLTEQTKFAVLELGANHLHEIAYTTDLVQPDIAVVNNFSQAHLAGFGSLEGVAQAKGEIFQGLNPKGVALINLDCNALELWQNTIGNRTVQSFSLDNLQADFYASHINLHSKSSTFTLHSPHGITEIKLAYSGKHNIANALGATALAMHLGANLEDIALALQTKMQVKGRLYFEHLNSKLTVIDDTYNANVASMQAGIAVLAGQESAYKILVLGDMGELGEQSEACHQQVGEFAKNSQINAVFTLGEKSQIIAKICATNSPISTIIKDFSASQTKTSHGFLNLAELMDCLIKLIHEKIQSNQRVIVLVKGSRSMGMERVVNGLKTKFMIDENINTNNLAIKDTTKC